MINKRQSRLITMHCMSKGACHMGASWRPISEIRAFLSSCCRRKRLSCANRSWPNKFTKQRAIRGTSGQQTNDNKGKRDHQKTSNRRKLFHTNAKYQCSHKSQSSNRKHLHRIIQNILARQLVQIFKAEAVLGKPLHHRFTQRIGHSKTPASITQMPVVDPHLCP